MKQGKRKRANSGARYLFLVPGLIVYITIIVVPALYSLWLSFFKWDGISREKEFVGFKNYQNLFSNYAFSIALKNNVIWVILTLVLIVGAALLLALLINNKFKGRVFVRSVLYFPCILSCSLAGVIWTWVYNNQFGMYNGIMDLIGRTEWKKAWLIDANTALYAVFLADLWNSVGQPMILFLAGLQTISKDLNEAARIDGANRFQVFFYVTIFQLKETFVIVIATQIIHAMKIYDVVRVMTDGGPANATETLSTLMVTTSFSMKNFGGGSAISVIMILLMIIVIIPYVSTVSKD